MGACCSKPQNVSKPKSASSSKAQPDAGKPANELENLKGQSLNGHKSALGPIELFKKVFSFTMDIVEKPTFSFQVRLAKESTDSVTCSKFTPQLAKEAYTEFLKFMCLLVAEITKSAGEDPQKLIAALKNPPLTASPVVDHVWRQATTYTNPYHEFCKKLLEDRKHLLNEEQMYIHRNDLRMIDENDAFTKYKKTLKLYKDTDFNLDKSSNPSQNLVEFYPNYESAKKMMADVNSYVWINTKKKESMKTIIKEKKLFNSKIEDAMKLLRENSETKSFTVRSDIPTTAYVTPPYNDKMIQEKYDKLEKVYSYVFGEIPLPQKLEKVVQDEQLISDGLAKRWVDSYKKFLIMCFISKVMVSPSREVDEIWHLHLSLTENYKEVSNVIFGKYLHHTPSYGGNSQDNLWAKLYAETMDFYKSLFNETAPKDIWPDGSKRFGHDDTDYSWVHLPSLIECTKRENEGAKANNASKDLGKKEFLNPNMTDGDNGFDISKINSNKSMSLSSAIFSKIEAKEQEGSVSGNSISMPVSGDPSFNNSQGNDDLNNANILSNKSQNSTARQNQNTGNNDNILFPLSQRDSARYIPSNNQSGINGYGSIEGTDRSHKLNNGGGSIEFTGN